MEYHYTNHVSAAYKSFFPLKGQACNFTIHIIPAQETVWESLCSWEGSAPCIPRGRPLGPHRKLQTASVAFVVSLLLLQFGLKSDIRLIQVPDWIYTNQTCSRPMEHIPHHKWIQTQWGGSVHNPRQQQSTWSTSATHSSAASSHWHHRTRDPNVLLWVSRWIRLPLLLQPEVTLSKTLWPFCIILEDASPTSTGQLCCARCGHTVWDREIRCPRMISTALPHHVEGSKRDDF